MKQTDIKRVKEYYEKYRNMLFKDSIPTAEEIEFKLHAMPPVAIGYSKHCDKPLKSGKQHIIAFSKWLKFTEEELQEVLVHEMIHVWQLYHVKEDRYKICSDLIAHDRLFSFKVNQVNLILEKNYCFFKVDVRYDHKLVYDDTVTDAVREKWKKRYNTDFKI